MPQPGSLDCSYCVRLNSNIADKTYCTDCFHRMHKECKRCKLPFPYVTSFALDQNYCNRCAKHLICLKEKRRQKRLQTAQLKKQGNITKYIHTKA